MIKKFSKYQLGWLIDSANDVAFIGNSLEAFERVDYPLASVNGEAWAEKLNAGEGITLFHAFHNLRGSPGQLIPIIDVDITPEQPVFNAQIWLSGSCCHREYWKGRTNPPVDIVARPGRDTFRFHEDWHATILIEAGVIAEMRSVVIADSTLINLLGDTVVDQMLNKLGLNSINPTVVHSMPRHVSDPLIKAMRKDLIGPARRLLCQAQILQYLAQLHDFLMGETKFSDLNIHNSLMHNVRDYLISLEGEVPTLSEIAKKYGISARRLNSEFLATHGKTIYRFISDYRLDQAHIAINQTQIPLKVLSYRMGYSHVNHFISAFKRKFGYTPGSLKRGIKA